MVITKDEVAFKDGRDCFIDRRAVRSRVSANRSKWVYWMTSKQVHPQLPLTNCSSWARMPRLSGRLMALIIWNSHTNAALPALLTRMLGCEPTCVHDSPSKKIAQCWTRNGSDCRVREQLGCSYPRPLKTKQKMLKNCYYWVSAYGNVRGQASALPSMGRRRR